MSYKLDKYVIKSLESIRSYALGENEIMVPEIYLQKISQYGGKISTSDIVFEVYSLLLNLEDNKICSKILTNVLEIFIMCGQYVPEDQNIKIFVSNIYVDVLFSLIIASCQKKICPKKVMELCTIVQENYLNSCDFNFDFALTQKMSRCAKPLLSVLKLLNRKEKSNKYVNFLRSQVDIDGNGLLNEQLGGMYDEAMLLNEYDEIKMLNSRVLDMIGGAPNESIRKREEFKDDKNPTNEKKIVTIGGKEYWANNNGKYYFNDIDNMWKSIEKARQEAARQKEAEEEKARQKEAEEEKARQKEKEAARQKEKEAARREAEEAARREAEEAARREAEKKARREAEKKARQEAEEKKEALMNPNTINEKTDIIVGENESQLVNVQLQATDKDRKRENLEISDSKLESFGSVRNNMEGRERSDSTDSQKYIEPQITKLGVEMSEIGSNDELNRIFKELDSRSGPTINVSKNDITKAFAKYNKYL